MKIHKGEPLPKGVKPCNPPPPPRKKRTWRDECLCELSKFFHASETVKLESSQTSINVEEPRIKQARQIDSNALNNTVCYVSMSNV